MKPLKISLALVLLCLIGILACHKSGQGASGSAINIQGFELLDFSGNLLGWQGTPDSDWMIRPSLSAAEMAVLNFNTNLSLDNTLKDPSVNVLAFPNPAWQDQLLDCDAPDSNVVKIVYVDSMLTVLKDTAVKIKGGTAFQLHFDAALFPDHSSRRIYFSFSAAGHPDYAVGYGDVRICSQASGSGVGNCF